MDLVEKRQRREEGPGDAGPGGLSLAAEEERETEQVATHLTVTGVLIVGRIYI